MNTKIFDGAMSSPVAGVVRVLVGAAAIALGIYCWVANVPDGPAILSWAWATLVLWVFLDARRWQSKHDTLRTQHKTLQRENDQLRRGFIPSRNYDGYR